MATTTRDTNGAVDVRTPHDDVEVPEPRTTDDDESDRPSPSARPGRLAARISSRR